MDGRRRADANRSVHRTRLTGRSPGTQLRERLVLVRSPDRGGGAGVADGARLIHGAERKRILAATQQAVDLDGGELLAGTDRAVAHAAPPAPPLPGDRCPLAVVDLFDCHVAAPVLGPRPLVAAVPESSL